MDNEGKPFLPVFLKSRIFVNFANLSSFEEEYEKLIRLIYDRPEKSRPSLGSPPSYLTENTVNVYKSGFLVSSIKNQLDRNPSSLDRISSEFFTLFEDELWEFVLPDIRDVGDKKLDLIENRLHDFQLLKKSFVDFTFIVTSTEYNFNFDYLISFFEKVNRYQKPRDENASQWYTADFEVLKIIFQELFVYCIAICIKNSNFKLAGELLNGTYVFESSPRRIDNPDRSFCGIILIPEIFNGHYNRSNIAPMGNYYLANLYKLSKDEFVTADVICYISCFLFQPNKSYYKWYPHSNAHYGSVRSHVVFRFFEKLESRSFYERIKPIFNDISLDEMKKKLYEYKGTAGTRISYGIFNEIFHVHEFLNLEKIGRER